MTKRFIEESFPIKEVSILSGHEKDIRGGHISALHIWWARKPLASSRTTAYAALIPASKNDQDEETTRKFITDFAKWKNTFNQGFIETARREILAANGGIPPRILDPFAGGGAMPLEALRLGCETYASELNPVAVLIEKATLLYPQKYGIEGDDSLGVMKRPLLDDVKKWAAQVFESASDELKRFYPEDSDGSLPVGYIWARTIACQNPLCGAEIPLIHQFWLAKTAKHRLSLFPFTVDGSVKFKIVGTGYGDFPKNFNPGKGTVSKAIATCLVCGSTVDANTTRRLFQEGQSDQRIIAVVLHKPRSKGKLYRIATPEDSATFTLADGHLQLKKTGLLDEWGIEPVPDEPLPPKGTLGFRVQNYGILKWGDLFNSRQNLALITFIERVKAAHEMMIAEGYDREYAKTITTYLALIVSRCSDYASNTVRWLNQVENPSNTFARQAITMSWGYFELNLLSTVLQGTFKSMLSQIEKSLMGAVNTSSQPATINQSSATSLPYPDDFFDAVFTDPPYYDNVPYSHLSDFFYVWLKRAVGDLYPELFCTQLTSKKNEIVAYSNRPADLFNGNDFFESMLKKSFQEIQRILKPNGIAIVVYAHKSTEGWETLINSLLDSGLIVTASWPLNTERRARLRAQESATITSSVYIIARKRERQKTAFYNEVKEELKKHLNRRLGHLWTEQSGPLDPEVKKLLGGKGDEIDLFSGADFFIAAVGSAIEVFGKYEKVIDYEGQTIRADKLLEDAQEIITDYAVKQILHNGFGGEITGLTRFYVLWRWNYGEAKVPFDDARKLAQSCGIDLTQQWGKAGFIQKESQFIRVLGPHMREAESMSGSKELIDVLHLACLLWGVSKRDQMIAVLDESGFGSDEAFYRVAQAISETLPNENKEKQLLEGFLAGKERLKRDMKQSSGQVDLSDWAS
jgi:adenine-specific DNA methylase